MDLLPYCRPKNLVSYDTFIDHLAKQDLVLIGEDHLSGVRVVDGVVDLESTLDGVDFKNEKKILTDLVNRRGNIRFAGEAVEESVRSPRKKALIKYFGFVDPIHLIGDSTTMASVLSDYISEEHQVVAIIGNKHLDWVQNLLRTRNNQLKLVSVYQIDSSVTSGIYNRSTVIGDISVIVGLISPVNNS